MVWLPLHRGHGGLLNPVLAAFVVWQKKNELAEMALAGSGWGVAPLALGFLVLAVGTVSSTLFVIIHYIITDKYGLKGDDYILFVSRFVPREET